MIGNLENELVGGVYALRSFGLERGGEEGTYTLGSVVSGAGSGWGTGSATATCNTEMRRIDHEGEPSPHKDCSCGVYAFNNLKMLFREYPLNAIGCVAVVSLEGTVFEHEFGYRAEKATIVAIWTGGDPSHSMENIIVDGNGEIQVARTWRTCCPTTISRLNRPNGTPPPLFVTPFHSCFDGRNTSLSQRSSRS